MPQQSFIDASKPNAGRIYDYLLGGSHNFDVDRIAGDRIRQFAPFLPKAMRLQRWCLQDLAIELTEKRDFDVIIDFASGLPTNDHIHHVVKPGSRVIYSDYDPVVVEYAHEILAGSENTYYFLADVCQPDDLLNRPEVLSMVGKERNVAFVLWGICGYLSNDEIIGIVKYLYNWSGQDSILCFNAQGADAKIKGQSMSQVARLYEQMGSNLHPRTLQDYKSLISPWKPDHQDFITLLDWHNIGEGEMTDEDKRIWGPGGGGYGAYLIK
ncbi:MAG: hypothetical protein GWN00_36670 [Aliifodinibius sp.]|nr:hypothetical protein [Fodinibius sp.]NIY30120.1 hypothetical protein [Fodinibius sp.]